MKKMKKRANGKGSATFLGERALLPMGSKN